MRHTIPFADTVTASSEKTVSSKRIPFPFMFKKVNVFFEPGSELDVQIKVFVSSDDNCPATGEPSGTSIFIEYGQVDYLRGDAGWVAAEDERKVLEAGMYIKMYAKNNDTFDHYLTAVVEIEDEFEKKVEV